MTHPALGETVYRCKGQGGAVSLQSDPCPAGVQQTARHYETPRHSVEAEARRQAIELEMAHRRVWTQFPDYTAAGGRKYYRGATRTYDQRGVQRARCTRAKRHRTYTLERVGLRRNFDLLRQLDERVYQACRGR